MFIPLELCTEPIELDENGKPPYARLMIEKGDDFERYTCQPVAAEPIDRMKNRPAGWWTIIEIPAYGILNAKIVFEPSKGHLYMFKSERPSNYQRFSVNRFRWKNWSDAPNQSGRHKSWGESRIWPFEQSYYWV